MKINLELHEYELENLVKILSFVKIEAKMFYGQDRKKKIKQLGYTLKKLEKALKKAKEPVKANPYLGCKDCINSKYYIKENSPKWHKHLMESDDEVYKDYQQTKFCPVYDSLSDEEKLMISKGYHCDEYDDEDK